ncbi:MAG: T9SS type A sorting domain-containing protein [Bacteroidetes bacterium]|nr:T9SS type A sorting domain-containing protein [Bacteroidota bacterium]
MKKLLLFAIAISLGVSVVAQMATVKPQAKFKTTVAVDQKAVYDPQPTYQGITNPYVSNDERAQDIVVGTTWYDLQSNSSMAYRIHAYPDGTMAATWTMASDASFADRGTGYNYFDGSNWGPYPTERLEDVRTGWPSYAPYGENGELVVSHSGGADGLIFSWRENKGTGEWEHFNLAGPDPDPTTNTLLWPRMITSGENNEVIHVIACAGNNVEYEGLTMALLYSRSDDGGETWDPHNVILDGLTPDDYNGAGGDDYAWAQPNAGTLAFVVFGGVADGILMKSTDGGDSWERTTFYASPDPFFNGDGGDLPQCGGGDGYNAVAIDDDGIVHLAFGRQIHLDDTPDDQAWSYYPYSDGIVYWNETMPALDTAQITATILPTDAEWENTPIYQNGQLAAWTQPNGEDTIIGVAPYYTSLTGMPQIVVNNGIVQIFSSALSVGFDNDEFNFRHIWGTFTEGDGVWSPFTDYTNDVFHIFSECVFPSVSATTYGDTYHILYQTDNLPGNSLQPNDAPTHDPVLNNMVYLPVSPVPVDVFENMAHSFEVSQNYPNPVNGQTYFTVTLNEGASVNVEIYSLTGQMISMKDYGYKMAGTHTLDMNASELASGVYFYTVSNGAQKVTHKMIVQ